MAVFTASGGTSAMFQNILIGASRRRPTPAAKLALRSESADHYNLE
jgi:hypothetical protein